MKNDSLFRLIKAMDKGEMRYCRDALLKSEGHLRESRIFLFDSLNAMNEYDAQALKKGVDELPISLNLAVEKMRLFALLVSHLKALKQSRLPANDPYVKLEDARILLELSLYEEAAEAVQKGLESALRMEELFAEVELREVLRVIYKNMNDKALTQAITENEYLAETASSKLATLIRYTHINDRAYDYLRRYRVTDDESKQRGMEGLIHLPEMTDINKANSLPSQLRYYYIWNCYHSSRNELEPALEANMKLLALLESNPARIERQPQYYISALSNTVGKLILLKRTNEVPKYLRKMSEVKVNGKRAEIQKFVDVELQHQLYYMNAGMMEESVARESIILAGLRRLGKGVKDSARLTFMYNLGVAHLVNDNLGAALVHFNRIKDLGELRDRKDLQGVARLLRLLLLSDPAKNMNLEHFLRNGKRFFHQKHGSYQMEATVYDWLLVHSKVVGNSERKESLKVFVAELTPYIKKGLLGAEEMLIWADSQIHGIPKLQVFKARAGLN